MLFVLPLITVLREGKYYTTRRPFPVVVGRHFNLKIVPCAYRNGSCDLRRWCLARPARDVHPACRNYWSHLRSRLWLPHLLIRQPNKYVSLQNASAVSRRSSFAFLALTVFLVVMTNFILLIGAGLFSRAVGSFQEQRFNTLYVYFLPVFASVPFDTLRS